MNIGIDLFGNSKKYARHPIEDEFDLPDTSNFDFWICPVMNPVRKRKVKFHKEEKLNTFLKRSLHDSKNNKVANSGDVIAKCVKILKSQIASTQNELLILKLLANLSAEHASAKAIESTDLMKWVEESSQSDSPEVYFEAWKILQNIAEKENPSIVYTNGIYPLIPPWKKETPTVDIVLVHGIQGGAAWTWRQHDSKVDSPCIKQEQRQFLLNNENEDNKKSALLSESYSWIWPLDWLPQRIKKPFRIIAVDYSANWLNWIEGRMSKYDLNLLSEDILWKLKAAGVGTRPVIWVAHSMGGLIVKSILQKEAFREVENASSLHPLSSSTRAIVFLSVPHFGSPLASWTCYLGPLLRPSQYVYDMKADCLQLARNHQIFVELCKNKSIQVLSLNETKPFPVTKNGPNIMLVPLKYGDPAVGQFYEVDASHIDICKPTGRTDEKYKIIEDFFVKIFKTLSS